MKEFPDPVKFPELVIGIAGPIGVNTPSLEKAIEENLSVLRYQVISIKLTKEMLALGSSVKIPSNGKIFDEYWGKMDYANDVRKTYKQADTLARVAILAIRRERGTHAQSLGKPEPKTELEAQPQERVAYVIRQLKHPDEVVLLRKVYGKQFILISAYGSEEERRHLLEEQIKNSTSTRSRGSEIQDQANRLIERDASESGEKLGQQLRDTFHLADVFVTGMTPALMKSELRRFFNALFGKTDITPKKDEYGMYAAKSASLRSSDLSRQVGAAVFTTDGELVVQGCNEVPKAHGGTYWDSELPDNRDVQKGFDPNDQQKRKVLRDVIERLRTAEFLSKDLLGQGSDSEIVDFLTKKGSNPSLDGPLADSAIMDLTEFGRVVHAEMCAICDAARLGRTVKGCTLYCTTFPCHNCTKHLIAAGIKRVVYMEPYPKSKAPDLHDDEIELESESDPNRVSFIPFVGVSPTRYRDIFQKGRRKDADGSARAWIENSPMPMLSLDFPSYTTTGEPWALAPLLGTFEQKNPVKRKRPGRHKQPISAAKTSPARSRKKGSR